MDGLYDRLGDILRDRLDSDEDPFDAWEPNAGKARAAGNARERVSPKAAGPARVAIPDELMEDYRVLGLMPGVSSQECKEAWKRLLKRYHPDRHSGDDEAEKRNTAVSVRLTASYRRIAHWFSTGDLLER